MTVAATCRVGITFYHSECVSCNFAWIVVIQNCGDTELWWYRTVVIQNCGGTELWWYRIVVIQNLLPFNAILRFGKQKVRQYYTWGWTDSHLVSQELTHRQIRVDSRCAMPIWHNCIHIQTVVWNAPKWPTWYSQHTGNFKDSSSSVFKDKLPYSIHTFIFLRVVWPCIFLMK